MESPNNCLSAAAPAPQPYLGKSKEFICGFGAGFTNICITYPLNKIIFRQMLHGVPTSSALAQLKKEGPFLLYRGILPPLCQKAFSMCVMFGTYDVYSKKLTGEFPSVKLQVIKSCSAGLAGFTEALLTPFERIQTLLQDRQYHKKFSNSVHTARHLYREHGFREFYRGYSMIVTRNSLSTVLFFAAREKAKKHFPETDAVWEDYLLNFISGGLIGAVLSTAFYPINIVKTRVQSVVGGPFHRGHSTFLLIYNERGRSWKKLFRGVHLNYTRSILSWGIINASYELYKHILS